jgi:hypothetical protein
MTTEKIYIGIDDQVIEATGEVLQEILNRRAEIESIKEAQIAEAQAKAQAKAVLLERLGLTQEEFNILTAQS